MKHAELLVCLIIILCPFLVPAQVYRGQKVALVLSGGAARGGAHIGVLRALEKNHIPVHCIVGTSMGAVIGGMYAAGYTLDEIERLITSGEFQRWADGAVNERYNFYFHKEDPNASWITTDISFRRRFSSILPTQIVNTFEIDLEMMRIFAPACAAARSNFDSLMIPFRCLVTDIDSSQQVIIRNGDLGAAIRGSMSIPIFFNPLDINGKLVFDGGIYNNFPYDVAVKEFKPDVIIGSRVAQRYDKPERDDVVSQLLTMLMERQSDTISYPGSVMIVPHIPSVGLLDFSKTSELADSGFRAAERMIARIRQLVGDSMVSSPNDKTRNRFNAVKPDLIIDSIYLKGVTNAQRNYMIKVLKKGKPVIGIDEFTWQYFRFLDEGFVRLIYPVARYNRSTGFFDLYLDVTPSGNFSAEFGGNFSLANTSEAFVELKYKYLWTKALRFYANGYVGRVYNSAKMNGRVDFTSPTPWFGEASFTYNYFNYFKNTAFFFDDKNPAYIIARENTFSVDLGMPVSMNGKVMLGADYAYTYTRYFQSNQFSRNDTADQTSFDFFAPSLTFDYNSMNRKQYPDNGIRLLLRLSWFTGTERMLPGSTAILGSPVVADHKWFQLRMIYDNYFTSAGPLIFGFYGEGVLSNQPLFANYISSLIYATPFLPVPEARTYFLPPFRATNYAATGLKTIWKISKKLEYRLEGYLFQPFQEIVQDPDDLTAHYGKNFADRSYMASTALVFHSPLGPIGISVNYFDKMPERFTLNFSIGYFIFNQGSMP